MEAQAQANIQQQQAAAQLEQEKQNAASQMAISVATAQSQLDIEKLIKEADVKKQLMELEFQFNMQLKDIEVKGKTSVEKQKEDRKDNRTKIQASQQSELIDQRKNNKPPKNFESSGNDIMGGIDLSQFGPR